MNRNVHCKVATLGIQSSRAVPICMVPGRTGYMLALELPVGVFELFSIPQPGSMSRIYNKVTNVGFLTAEDQSCHL